MYYASFDIVFQEIPDETTLALTISNCPFHCHGCHSKHLRKKNYGVELTYDELDSLIKKYEHSITCVCFMGGDADLDDLWDLALHVKTNWNNMKVAWYSGAEGIHHDFPDALFDYVKVGPYIESYGGLKSPKTNQRLYRIIDNQYIDITYKFWNRNG